jgi:hypothetical protein
MTEPDLDNAWPSVIVWLAFLVMLPFLIGLVILTAGERE